VTKPSPNAARELLNLACEGESWAEADDAMGCTDCPDGCYVEPDGSCPHGYESAAITAEVI
jgi:hypothetical protein